MITRIIPMGKSLGIAIPKPFLRKSGLGDRVEMEVQDDSIVIKSPGKARAGWAEAFASMAAAGDDICVDQESFPATQWDEEEWEW